MLDEFFPNADLAFGVLGTELWSPAGAGLATARSAARSPWAARSSGADDHQQGLAGETFDSERAHGLLAPWVLHTGLGPDAAASGYMTQVIAVAVQEGGMPIPRGGGPKLVESLARLIRETEASRDRARRRARPRLGGQGDRCALADGETVAAGRAVIANVTPTQLYGRLLGDGDVPPELAARSRYRYGRGEMQIHWHFQSRLAGTATSGWAGPRSCT